MQSKGKTKGVSIAGFSVVEMMVVIVIIGLLGTLALSRYYTFTARGRQAEARLNLKTINDLQESWKYENESYNTGETSTTGVGAFGNTGANKCAPAAGTGGHGKQLKNELGFRPKKCTELRYGYTWTSSKSTAESTKHPSKLIYSDCLETDKWMGDYEDNSIDNVEDVVEKCK